MAEVVAIKLGDSAFEWLTPGEGKKDPGRLAKNGQWVWVVF